MEELQFSDILRRLKIFFNTKTNKELSSLINIESQKLNSWSSRNTIPIDALYKLSIQFNLNLHWLLTGVGQNKIDNSSISNTNSNNNNQAGNNVINNLKQNDIDNKFYKLFESSYYFAEEEKKLPVFKKYLATANAHILS